MSQLPKLLFWLGWLVLVAACKPDPIHQPQPLLWQKPAHFPPVVYANDKNQLSIDGIKLGRTLFFDKGLSSDGTVSCASCHQPANAFADRGNAFSRGVQGRIGRRNSPALFNLAWNSSFIWDGGVNHLDVLALAPLTDPNEMNADLATVLAYLRSQPAYKQAFAHAFGDTLINDQRFLWALAQYQLSLVSAQSPFDQWWLQGQPYNPAISPGWQLFQQHCASCHLPPLFTTGGYANNGIDSVFADAGRGGITLLAADSGKFKIPSLRQLRFSAPYMHDGRLLTLEAVVAYYADSTAKKNASTDVRVQQIPVLSPSQQVLLIQFLDQLNDPTFGKTEVQNN
jgi:cytochrome c peroxidase